jgi:hypothetical protein
MTVLSSHGGVPSLLIMLSCLVSTAHDILTMQSIILALLDIAAYKRPDHRTSCIISGSFAMNEQALPNYSLPVM